MNETILNNFSCLKHYDGCNHCQYNNDDRCTNKHECFWTSVENHLKALKLLIEKDAEIKYIKEAIAAEVREGNPKIFPAVGFYNRGQLDVTKCFTDEEFEIVRQSFDE